ncbi:MAG: hypothetical protein AAGB13_18210 [Cyanobacteria bacterium P01_F01_bin.33]
MAPDIETLKQQIAAAQAREQQLMAELERRPSWSEFEEVQQQFERDLTQRPNAEQLQEAKRKQEIAEAHHLVLKRQHAGLQQRVVELERECAEARSYSQTQERELAELEANKQELEAARQELKERLYAVERQNIQLKATLDKCLAECQEYRTAARVGIPTGEIAIPDGNPLIPAGEIFAPAVTEAGIDPEIALSPLGEFENETGRHIGDRRIQEMVAASAEHVAARIKSPASPQPPTTAAQTANRPQVDLPAFVQRRPLVSRG